MPIAASVRKPRVLHCIAVYRGRSSVCQALQSAARMDTSSADYKVLILDDSSPEAGCNEYLRDTCAKLDVDYYRSPRRLGPPRTSSLGLLGALKNGYDYVLLSSCDALFPANLLTELLATIGGPSVGSVTAWSHDLSISAIPNGDPGCLNTQTDVDWIGETTSSLFRGQLIDIPSGSALCVMIPTAVVDDVGIMDPVYGHDGGEVTDWKLRSLEAGYRICLAPGAFVYKWKDAGEDEGVDSKRRQAAAKNEALIDLRYPAFRSHLRKFRESNLLEHALRTLNEGIISSGARQFGYTVEVRHRGSSFGPAVDRVIVEVEIGADGFEVGARYKGFTERFPNGKRSIRELLVERFKTEPVAVNVYARGAMANVLERDFKKTSVSRPHNYPSLVVTQQP